MPSLWLQEGRLGIDSLRRQYGKPLFVLMTMVGLILAIACANIANLLLSRASARRREMAVRMSLGAGRWRVIRQLLTESILLSCTGGVLGLIVAVWGIRSILWLLSPPGDELTLHAGLNWTVLAFTLALALGTGVTFGLAPAIQATGRDFTPALKETRSSAVSGHRKRFAPGLGHVLIISQVALSLVLAVAAGLFVRTLSRLNAIELGFNRDNILVFTLNAKQGGYKGEALAAFYSRLTARFRAIPGVQAAALSDMLLVSYHWNDTTVTIPGAPAPAPDKRPNTALIRVDPGFLAVMQIPVLVGRDLDARDLRSPRVAVVTEQFVKKYFPGENPVGRRIGLHDTKAPADIEIIGVAKTTRYNSLKEEETPPLVYIPYSQDMADLGRVTFELRTGANPLTISGIVRGIVHDASPTVPIMGMTTQSAVIDQTISEQRTFANLCTGFAALALLIACVGLYGTMAYSVARRTNEIGIRMALGAARGGIVWMVFSQVTVLAAIGIAIGLGIAWQTGHFVASFLYGVKPTDSFVMAGAALALITAAAAAGFGPAWRASRVDPMAALRHE
jgi:predicted permease